MNRDAPPKSVIFGAPARVKGRVEVDKMGDLLLCGRKDNRNNIY